MRCQISCASCNRGVREFPDRDDYMTGDHIRAILDEARRRKDEVHIKKFKCVGGEPAISPYFEEIYHLLVGAAEEGLIDGVKINTNTVTPPPASTTVKHPKVRWLRSPVRKKKHLPHVISPSDLGMASKEVMAGRAGCSMPFSCGFSVDPRGWLPCSPAILIAGGFDLEHLYKHEIPTAFWGPEACAHCIHSISQEWKKEWYANNRGLTIVSPSPSWEAALKNYGEKHHTRLRMPVSKNAKMPMLSLPVLS